MALGALGGRWLAALALLCSALAQQAADGEALCRAAAARTIIPFRSRALPLRIHPETILDLDAARNGGALAAGSAAATALAMSDAQRSAWVRLIDGLVGAGHINTPARPPAVAGAPDLRLLVFGGSMLAGGCCDDRKEPRWSPTCTYAKRFADSVARHYRRADGTLPVIEYQSLAAGGTTTEGVLPSLPALIGRFGDDAAAGVPTLLLVDYSVNDAWEVDAGAAAQLSASLESLLRYALRAHPSIALLLCETYAGRNDATPSPLPTAYAVAERYGVAHLRYARVVREWKMAWGLHCGLPGPSLADADGVLAPRGQPRPSDAPRAHARAVAAVASPHSGVECSPHPSWITHQLIADVATYSLVALGGALCGAPRGGGGAIVAARLPAPAASAELLAAREVCERCARRGRAISPCGCFALWVCSLVARPGRVGDGGAASRLGRGRGRQLADAQPHAPPPRSPSHPPHRPPPSPSPPWLIPRPSASYSATLALRAARAGAVDPLGGARAAAGANWTLAEDRPGKAGWLSHGVTGAGAKLSFALSFGARPRITLSYLRGYDDALGTVELSVSRVVPRPPPGADRAAAAPALPPPRRRPWLQNRARLAGRRTDGVRVSQSAVLAIKADDERMQNYAMGKVWARSFVGVIGFGVPPYANATLDVTMVCERCDCARGRACKFKILSIVAC